MVASLFRIKKNALLLFLAIINFSLFSQVNNYKAFPLNQASWIVTKTGPFPPGGPAISYGSAYEANGDTIIGGNTYKKVYVAYTSNGLPFYGPKSFIFAYRNDIPEKKVYIFTKINGLYKDTLWYDFNLNIGDTIKESYSRNDIPLNPINYGRIIVKSIDSILICNEYNKRFSFCGDAFKTALVEGYGFEDNFVQMGYNYACPFEPGYTYTTLFSCELGMSEIRTSIKPLQILPNPVLNTLQINFPEQNIGSAFGYSIVDCSGKEVFRGKSSVNNTIDVSGIKKGLYLLRVTDYQNNVFQNKFLKQ